MEVWQYCLIAIGTLIIVAAIIVALYFSFIKKARLRSQIKKITDRYHYLLDVMQNDCENRMARIKEMADKGAPGFDDIYMDILNDFRTLANQNRYDTDLAIKNITATSKTAKISVKDIRAAEKSLYILEREMTALKTKIDTARTDDDSYHAMILDSKARLRDLKTLYSEHEIELRPVEAKLDDLFQSFENSFDKYESALDIADYKTAKEELTKINKVLDNVEKNGRELHIQLPLILDVIPQRINKIESFSKETEKDDIFLDELHVDYNCDRLRQEASSIGEDLQSLNLTNVKKDISQLIDQLDNLENSINNEISSKDNFLSSKDQLDQDIDDLNSKFDMATSMYENSQGKYMVNEESKDSYLILKEKVVLMHRIQRELTQAWQDECKTPYSRLSNTQEKLESFTKEIDDGIDKFFSSIENMNSVSTRIIADLSQSYFDLCQTRRLLNEIDVRSYTKAKNKELISLIREIEDLNAIANKTPVDIITLEAKYNSYVERRDAYIGMIKRNAVMANKAEMLMAYANQQRSTSRRISEALDASMIDFFNGDFNRSYEILDKEFRKDERLAEY